MKKKNYYSLFKWAATLLLILMVVIYCTTDGLNQLWAFAPGFGIIGLGALRLKLDEKEKNTPSSYNYRYRYPRK